MATLTNEIEELVELEGVIGEMGAYDTLTRTDLKIPDDFMATVRANDDDPLFVTAEVESGWSASKRRWKPEHLKNTVDKVNKDRMAGNLGHPLLKREEHEGGFPIPQVAWAVARMEGTKAIFKGYVLKTAEARELLKLGLIDGVSIFGDSKMRPIQGGYDVIEFNPETIDFARKGRSGMKSRIVNLTGEMAPEGVNTVDAKDIAALSEDEIRTHAPLLVKEIERKASEPFEARIGEQVALVADLQPQVDVLGEIKKLLKLEDGDNPIEKLTNLIEKIEDGAKSEIKDFVNSLVSKKIKSERGQALVRRLIGEMETAYEGDLTDELKAKIETDFNAKVESDEDIIAVIGEMKPGSEDEDGSGGGSALGRRSRTGALRGREDKADGVVKRNDNIVVRKVTL